MPSPDTFGLIIIDEVHSISEESMQKAHERVQRYLKENPDVRVFGGR